MTKNTKATAPKNQETGQTPAIPFETAMGELESLVRQMEEGALGLEESLLAYKRGAELVAQCRHALESAEQQVKILEAGVLKPFEADYDEE